MNVEEELQKLRGEALATQLLLLGIAAGLNDLGEPFRAILQKALDNADHTLNVGIDKIGAGVAQVHFATAYTVLEQFRAAALGGEGQPKSGI